MEQTSAQGGMVFGLVMFVLIIFMIVVMWKLFTKAGRPGWHCLIPIYNVYAILKIAGRPGWWLILFFIPVINFIIGVILPFDIAKRFGKGVGFGFGLLLLGIIFYPILAFDDSVYIAPPQIS